MLINSYSPREVAENSKVYGIIKISNPGIHSHCTQPKIDKIYNENLCIENLYYEFYLLNSSPDGEKLKKIKQRTKIQKNLIPKELIGKTKSVQFVDQSTKNKNSIKLEKIEKNINKHTEHVVFDPNYRMRINNFRWRNKLSNKLNNNSKDYINNPI